MNRSTLRRLVVSGFAAGIVLAGTPALAAHDGPHRPRPLPPPNALCGQLLAEGGQDISECNTSNNRGSDRRS